LWAVLALLPPPALAEAAVGESPPAEATPPAEAVPVAEPPPAAESKPAETSPPAANPTPPKAATPPANPQPADSQNPADEAAKKLVRLDFQGQDWLPVLQWLADIRKLNLDWQQLPDGTVNLASAKEYRVEEAEDLINMQLLARGFTLLQRGEVLRVAMLKNLDVTLVPRVDAEELATLPRHQFVRVTFPLDWMIAEEAAVEFKPLISPYGQLFPMASSNRLEAIDAVVNLRELYRLLKRAEGDEGRRERVAEFRLKHRKANDVAANVRKLLGLVANDVPAPEATQAQLDIEKIKLRSEVLKQLGTNAQPLLADKGAVQLVVNDKENSILVSGRPDKIELARQAIEAMDRPEPPRETSWETLNRVKIYEVSGFDPTTISILMQTLQQQGNIRKETQVQHEAAYNRLVVVASPEDHLTVAKIIENFRTERRRAEVLPLEQVDAQYAAKAIQLVLKNPSRPATAPGPASEGLFQIEADTTHNRLLIWATPAESAEVREFLGRLGETFTGEKATANMHVVRLHGAKSADILQRLKRAWNEIGNAPLIIEPTQHEATAAVTPAPITSEPAPAPPAAAVAPTPVTPATDTPAPRPVDPPTPASNTEPNPQPTSDRSAGRVAALLVAQLQAAPQPTAQTAPANSPAGSAQPPEPAPATPPAKAGEPSPVRVITDDDGEEMIILSRDPAAAEAAKKLVEQIVPDVPEVKVITLKHAQAAQVKFQLDTLLLPTQPTDTTGLNTRKAMTIDADSRINRLMIQHATPQQMAVINEIIPVLDQPTQEDERLVRQQRIYRCQRKRASEVVLVLKEVYRDLLSTNDKVFDARVSNRPFGYNQAMAATSKSPEYQGLLSVGSDDAGNIVVLSAPAYLMDEVMALVERIDATGTGESLVVVPVSKAARPKLGEALGRLLAKP
jgi:type II secretory pathway component GspD/PulD (secretin)